MVSPLYLIEQCEIYQLHVSPCACQHPGFLWHLALKEQCFFALFQYWFTLQKAKVLMGDEPLPGSCPLAIKISYFYVASAEYCLHKTF